MLPRLDAGELLEQGVADEETHRRQESNHPDPDRVVASVSLIGDDADRVAVLVFCPPLRRDAPEDDDGEELRQRRKKIWI